MLLFNVGKLGKHLKLVTLFVYAIDDVSAIFSNLEPGSSVLGAFVRSKHLKTPNFELRSFTAKQKGDLNFQRQTE